MINHLRVENLAVVKSAELSFTPKLNILTGETGAGKSILIDAILLLTQKRFPSGIVRNGAEKLVVEALFSRGEDEYVLRREIENNRSAAFINGSLATFQQLRETAASFLTVYGQRDHIFLLHTANHQSFLDLFSNHQELLSQLSQSYRRIRSLEQELQELIERSTQAQQRSEELVFQIQEIEKLNMKEGDELRLNERQKILAEAETIVEKASQLLQDLYQKEQCIHQNLAQNRAHVEYLRSLFPDFTSYADELERFYNLIPEVSGYLNALMGRMEFDESEFDRIEQQLQQLEKLKTKYKIGLGQLLARCEEMKKERGVLVNLEFSLQEKKKEIDAALQEYRALNVGLRESRKRFADQLSRKVCDELAKLEMKKAVFLVCIEENEVSLETVGEKGTDNLEFYFSSNPGQKPGPLADVASGGELSRLMLVLKSISSNEGDATYIFDEIDAGIGGKTAEFVGEKLRQISDDNQVICISHLPQIASFADRHFLISKEFKNNQTFSKAKILSPEERIEEIARLMAGSSINDDVLKAAEGLLQKNSR